MLGIQVVKQRVKINADSTLPLQREYDAIDNNHYF
jgi:hypothetical protein